MATNGRKKYYQEQRQHTLSAIDEAIIYLRDNGVRITKSSIAREAEIHRNTLNQLYVEKHLIKVCPELYTNDTPNKIVADEELAETCGTLATALAQCQKENDTLKKECKYLRSSCQELNQKYKRLLGEYQKIAESKIVRM